MKFVLAAWMLVASNVFAGPLTIVTTSGSGSLSDQVARNIQPLLAKELGRDVVVMNIPGANGAIGFREFHRMPKEAGNVLIGSFALAYVAKTMPPNDFDPLKDFVPVTGLTHVPMRILVPANSPAKDVRGLVELSKAKGGLMGGSTHPSTSITLTLLDKKVGTSTTHVNYRQAAHLYTDLTAGLLDYTIGGNQTAVSFIEDGRVRDLGRIDEMGIEDFSWTGLFVQAGNENGKVAEAIKRVINAQSMNIMGQPFLKADADDLRRLVKREYALIPSAKD